MPVVHTRCTLVLSHLIWQSLYAILYSRWYIMPADGAQDMAVLRRQRQMQQARGQLRPRQPVDACRKWKVCLTACLHPPAQQIALCYTWSCDSHLQLSFFRPLRVQDQCCGC